MWLQVWCVVHVPEYGRTTPSSALSLAFFTLSIASLVSSCLNILSSTSFFLLRLSPILIHIPPVILHVKLNANTVAVNHCGRV